MANIFRTGNLPYAFSCIIYESTCTVTFLDFQEGNTFNCLEIPLEA